VTISINNHYFTDNSSDATNKTTFVTSNQNEQYIENAKNNGCNHFIKSSDLKNYFNFSKIKIVGITGTNGKTTTAGALYSLLLDLGYKVALQGTRGFFINDKRIEEYSLTTPVQLGNFAHIQQAIDNQCDFFIMEVSSHSISQNRIEGLDFELKIHTNITSDHLDYHNTLQEYIDIKNSFFQDDSKKLINKDDKKVKYNIKNAFAYGLDEHATYKVQSYHFDLGMDVSLQYYSDMFSFTCDLMGLFNVYNMTAAVSASHILTNKPLQEICDVLENFAGVKGRMQIVNYNPFILVDFAHTPDAMKKVFDSFLDKDIIVVFGAGGNRDRTKRPIMGRIANEYAKHIIVTADNPRFEDPDLICEDIVAGIVNKDKLTILLNRKEAITTAINKSKEYSNSVILVLGKGDEEHQIIYDKKLPFSDDEVIKEIINAK
jgi:UDP-N-acetylmuramoyl-L-alanyl-D-glutamate--2,6-diaminopimelate ligase